MDTQSTFDSNVASRATELIGKRTASSTSSGHGSHNDGREFHGGISHGQGYHHHATMFHQDPNLQQQQPYLRSPSHYQASHYYDQGGYTQGGMSVYDPTRMPNHINTSDLDSKSSTLDQPISPFAASYYSPSPINTHQAQHSGTHPAPFPHYQPSTSNIDGTYHGMRSMHGAGMSNIVGLPSAKDSNLQSSRGIAASPATGASTTVVPAVASAPVPATALASATATAGAAPPPSYANTAQHDADVNQAQGVYYQQYPTSQTGAYETQQQSYYPSTVSTPMPNVGVYPANMSEMQGGYSQPQYNTPNYGGYQPQYAMNSYPTHQQSGAPYFANPRAGWSGGQQWRPPYYTYPNVPSGSSMQYARSSRSNNNIRSRGPPSSNTLPMRPGGSVTPMSSSSEPRTLDNVGEGAIDPSSLDLEVRVPGKGLRQHYHPQQGPRSDHVLWCGNVPSDASVEELWDFFSRLPPDDSAEEEEEEEEEEETKSQQLREGQENDLALSPNSGHGVMSVFIIARSNCAFVNYATPRHLKRAVSYFHGQSLRPSDSRCPKLVCRVRKKDDEAQAGVAGQRGRGIHVAWVKEQDRKQKQKARSLSRKREQEHKDSTTLASSSKSQTSTIEASNPVASATSVGLPMTSSSSPDSSFLAADATRSPTVDSNLNKGDARPSVSVTSVDSSSGSISYTSTNSSLFRHPAFHERFFILKSLGTEDLDRSVQTGLWATQPHNEQVLDQAYRNSESVFLIFSANQSGGFYGYARMAGTILSSRENQQLHMSGASSDGRGVVLSGNAPIRAAMNRPDAIPEGDEVKGNETTRGESLDVALADSSAQIIPGVGANNNTTTATTTTTSPLPLTPGGDGDSPVSKLTFSPSENLSWPIQKKDRDQSQGMARSQSLSNKGSDPAMMPSSTSTPALIMTKPSGDDQSDEANATAILQPEATLVKSTIITSIPVPMDENGVRRKDMVAEITSVVTPNGSQHTLPASLSDIDSLGPMDSASYDSKAQQQLAVRALIHNLRLEERESVLQAEELEKSMTDSMNLSDTKVVTQSSTSRAGSSDSFGKPFKVEWIKSTPLSFSQVRKLRNPWRDNRQIKVSRDGTELEPNVGRLLLKEWERAQDGKSAPSSEMASARLGEEEEDDE